MSYPKDPLPTSGVVTPIKPPSLWVGVSMKCIFPLLATGDARGRKKEIQRDLFILEVIHYRLFIGCSITNQIVKGYAGLQEAKLSSAPGDLSG
jgi:hypothetical protein